MPMFCVVYGRLSAQRLLFTEGKNARSSPKNVGKTPLHHLLLEEQSQIVPVCGANAPSNLPVALSCNNTNNSCKKKWMYSKNVILNNKYIHLLCNTKVSLFLHFIGFYTSVTEQRYGLNGGHTSD